MRKGPLHSMLSGMLRPKIPKWCAELAVAVMWVGFAYYWTIEPRAADSRPFLSYASLGFAALYAVKAFIGWDKGRYDA